MTTQDAVKDAPMVRTLSDAERIEMQALGLLDRSGRPRPLPLDEVAARGDDSVTRHVITNDDVLNEAFDYEPTPSSFTRGLCIEMKANTRLLLISGTASIDERGETVYVGDFRAQCWRTFRNITELLKAEGASWHDIVRTSCYLRDIERDYKDFNEVRTHFYGSQKLVPLPASTGIQARLCREDLLVEIEAIAMLTPETGA